MGHWKHKTILFSLIFTACFCYSNACLIDGTTPGTTLQGWVKDIERGTLWQNQTTGVESIYSSNVGGVTDNRQYLNTDIVDSRFQLFTTALFDEYEEHEVVLNMTVSVFYRCTGGTISFMPQTILVHVIDTNNNPPTFMLPPSSDEFVFTIAAPMPPGYEITSCLDLIVRDIDLTTQKIIFEIEDNPYFEIQKEVYRNPSTPKEFKAIIRTKTFIRTFPEEVKLTIRATDNDTTGDDPRTKETVVRFLGNTDFVLPEEPVFSETFYLADYTDDSRVVLTEPISLQSGYDKLVQFNIGGVYSENFELLEDQENERSIRVIKPLEGDDLEETNIHIIVTADRDLTSGASTTVVLRLPEVVPLEFQRAHYEGTIEDNILRVSQLILSQGYGDGPVTTTVRNEHSSYFRANAQGNSVTLSMTPLDENIVMENSFINLEIFATNGRSSATTIVTLEIIKDDNVTPIFNKPIYTGSYGPAGLIIETIVLVQGYNGIDAIELHGEDKDYFRPRLNGATVTIEIADDPIPPEIYSKERIVVSLEVTKPRTVGASATIIINLPTARDLQFGASTHKGSLQNNELTLDPIPLTVGYDNSVVFTINGDYAEYFRVTNDQNPAIITLEKAIPSSVILDNNIIFLTLAASGLNAVTTTTSVLLDIIKDDMTTPVFSRNIYYGTYLGTSNFNIENINLAQGSAGVTFRLDGDHAQYFNYREEGNNVVVFPRSSIPEDVIFKEKVLVFNILAVKALTVGASAAISIRFPSDLTDRVIMGFSQNTYTGTLESSSLTVDSIVLSSGYAAGTDFILTGDYSQHFSPTPNNNIVSLSLVSPLPIEATENAFILLELEARRDRAVSVWTSVVIEVVRQEIVPPVFAQAYYRGAYNAESGLQFTQVISLSDGYDDTVSISLDGEFSSLFELNPRVGNSLSIVAPLPISIEVLQANSQFLFTVIATKPGAVTARSAVSIEIEKELMEQVILRFAQSTYTGTIGSSGLTVDSIVLSSGYAAGTEFILTGDYSQHFSPTPTNNIVSLSLLSPLPIEATENAFILLELEARRDRAVSVWTSVVIEVVRQEIVPPVFTQVYYRGAYNAESGLQFTQVISLSDGYDDTVSISLDGEFSSLFELNPRVGNSLSIVAPLPISNEVLQANSQFLFTVIATKPGAVTARSAVSIEIEKDLTDRVIMGFSQNTYTGTLESSSLTVDSIVLSSGYAAGTDFILTGDYSQHFSPTPNNNIVSLSLVSPLPIEATENAFILLELEARRDRAVSVWTSVVIEVVRQEIVPPVFAQAYYRGAYNAESGLQFTQVISLSDGYDDTVSISLDGEFSSLFELNPRVGNSLSIVAPLPISIEVLQANSQFLFTVIATKPGAVTARSAVSIEIEKELMEQVILRFAQSTYTGTIGSSGLTVDSIVLSSGYAAGTEFILTGDYSQHFSPTPTNNIVSLSLLSPLPIEATENAFILLELEARRDRAVSVWTSVVIEVVRQEIVPPVFTQVYYRGAYNAESGLQFTQVISLSDGYDDTVSISLDGEFSSLFELNPRVGNSLSIVAPLPISNEVLQANSQFLFTVIATKPGAVTARSAVSIEIEKDLTDRVIMGFSQNTYTGTLESSSLTVDSIVLSSGYAAGTDFILTGDYSQHFSPTPNNNIVSLSLLSPLPIEATENAFILLELEARRDRAVSVWTSVVIEVVRQEIVPPVFAQAYYRGAYNAESGLQFTQVISLSDGYDDTVSISLDGEFSSLFELNPRVGNSLSIVAPLPISIEVLQANSQFLFTVIATKPGAVTARSAVSIEIEKELMEQVILRFAQSTYTGTIGSSGLTVDSIVLSSGYAAGTEFILTGDYSQHFSPTPTNNIVSLSLLSPLPIEATENAFILLELEARRDRAVSVWTSVVIEVVRQEIVPPVFTQVYYRGAYNAESGLQFTQVISLSDGYDDTVSISLDGEFSSLFELNPRVGNSLSIVAPLPISNEVLQANSQFLFTVIATKPGAVTARSAVSIEIEKDLTDRVVLRFAQSTYTGTIESSGLTVDSIVLSSGYAAGTEFILTGDYSQHFSPTPTNNIVSLSLLSPLPIEAAENAFILLELEARRERAVSVWTSVVIEVVRQEIVPPVFTQVYYRGAYNTESGLQFTQVISLSDGYDDTVSISLDGEFSSLFDLNPRVGNSLSIVAPLPISNEVLQANNQFLFTVIATKPGAVTARSAVSIEIEKVGVPLEPSVTFSPESYLLSVDISQTGLVGRVSATADKGEELTFSLETDDAHLQTRLSINNEGELYLSAPANSGVYNFQVIATTVITQATGTAVVHLTVQSVMHPLIILEKDEESAHSNLVVLDSTQHAGCHFTLTNRWPADQTWLYVDEFGLHTHSIDREHASIAFMALSQVQVELILHCRSDTDGAIREKRSETKARLGPYDYGSNNWTLTDTIPYNSRRSLVNLIVNDINDNDPIFVGKEHEPIVVGYPTDELEERILPRSLAELKATDADIGVNAALRYWSSESVLAVAPTTGFVHVRTGARLTHDQTLTVTATDENGQGRSGNILLTVKLLDLNHIAVVTIRDAFLDDETTVLAQLSDAVGYEVKALRSVVISDDIDGDVTRKKREAGTPRASLQLFVYGINEREPVTVDRLATDISANAAIASVVSTIPLEDHLQDINILDPQIGLLVATIILSVLLFIVIVIVAIWFFLRWRKTKNYDEFNAENSLSSRNASLGELPKPEVEKPRLNIEDLKRSEKRLQEMLQAPIEKVTIEPMPKKTETPVEAKLDLPVIEPSASTSVPIVIQSIDKLKDAEESSDDEFGEVSAKPRKSVVTFNENVEKIIHVEDNADDDSDDDDVSISANVDASNSGYEIYRL